jgi:hypothetical protein
MYADYRRWTGFICANLRIAFWLLFDAHRTGAGLHQALPHTPAMGNMGTSNPFPDFLPRLRKQRTSYNVWDVPTFPLSDYLRASTAAHYRWACTRLRRWWRGKML